jgi:hypothetical protein
VCVPWEGTDAVCGGFPSWPHKTCFPFSKCRNGVFCVKKVHRARTTVEENSSTTIEEHIHNMFHTQPPHTLSLREVVGTPAVSHRCRWNHAGFELRVLFSLLQEKSFFSSRTCHFCVPIFFRFACLPTGTPPRWMRRNGTSDASHSEHNNFKKIIKMGDLREASFYVTQLRGKKSNLEYGSYSGKHSRNGLSPREFYGF